MTESNQEAAEQPKEPQPSKVFLAVRQLGNATTIKLEQSSTGNIRVTIAGGEKSDSLTLSRNTAKALQAMLRGCLESY